MESNINSNIYISCFLHVLHNVHNTYIYNIIHIYEHSRLKFHFGLGCRTGYRKKRDFITDMSEHPAETWLR